MAKTVLNKEQLDTKEVSNKELDTVANISKPVSFNSKDSNADIQSQVADNKLSKDPLAVNDIPIDNMSSPPSSIRKYISLMCISIGILIFACIFSTAFALANSNNDKILDGISVNGIDLSGLTSDEATQKLTDIFSKKLTTNLTLTYADYKAEITPSQDFDANYDISTAVKTAYSIGRSGNIVQNNYEILSTLLATKKINISLQYSNEKLVKYIDDISTQIPGLVQHPSYYTENENLIILKGHSGVELLQDNTKNLILSNIEKLSTSNSIDISTQNVEPNKIDINKIYEEMYSEPKNAYIVEEPFEINLGSYGIDFAITLEEAENLLKEEKDEYIIPLKLTPPEIGVEDLGDNIFVDNLGTFSSTYKESNVNRSTNVKLASNKINNVILLPGEEFSYNRVVGERTFANGFKEASVYTSSGVVNGLGGGICQVSSTLYNSVLRANLEIVERRNHRYAVSYVPLGTDATVAYGSIDFRFKNNRKYPIKIISSSQNGVCSVSIMGIKEETEYEVSITTKRLQTIPYTTKYIENSSLDAGVQKQTQYGDNGYKYETYKTLKLNGNIVSSEKISNDTYTPLTRVVMVGTKQAHVPPPQTTTIEPNNNTSAPDNSSTDVPENSPESTETPSVDTPQIN